MASAIVLAPEDLDEYFQSVVLSDGSLVGKEQQQINVHTFVTSYKTAVRVHAVRLLLERACHPDHQSPDPLEFGTGIAVGALEALLAQLQRQLIDWNNRLRAAYQTCPRLTLLQGRTLMRCVLAMR